ncbi:hypothetical protein BDV19DRAFT_253753 [Aspergillus venezuelensis]
MQVGMQLWADLALAQSQRRTTPFLIPSRSKRHYTSCRAPTRCCWPECICISTPYPVVIDNIRMPVLATHTMIIRARLNLRPAAAAAAAASGSNYFTGSLGKPNIPRALVSRLNLQPPYLVPRLGVFSTSFVGLLSIYLLAIGARSVCTTHGHLPDFGIRNAALRCMVELGVQSSRVYVSNPNPSVSSFSGF